MYKSGWTGNQYVRTNKVSSLGKSIGRTGNLLGLYSLFNSVMEFNEASNIDGKYLLDLMFLLKLLDSCQAMVLSFH